MSTMNSSTRSRMSGDERREAILEAATRAFAISGYHGTSTDAVAREAGVSQPYVVRMFGTKLELFLEVFQRAVGRMSLADTELLQDHAFLQVMLHGFSAGGIDEIAAAARSCMGEVFATIRRTGWTDEEVRDFIAYGMLLNVMISMRALEHLEPDDPLAPLTACAFGETVELLESPA